MKRRRSDDDDAFGQRIELGTGGTGFRDEDVFDQQDSPGTGGADFRDEGPIKEVTEKRKGTPVSRLGCWFRIAIVVVAVVLAYQYVLRPLFEGGFGMADTREVPGDPASFDPIASLGGVSDFAGSDAQLISIDARFVRSDGTMDLTASYTPGPRVNYEFALPTDPPADAPPVGAGGGSTWYLPVTIEVYQPGQWRHVTSMGGGVSTEYSYMNKGMDRDTSSPTTSPREFVPEPTCSFADLWQVAIQQKEAPEDAVATITYDGRGYYFRISDLGISEYFDADCQLTGR